MLSEKHCHACVLQQFTRNNVLQNFGGRAAQDTDNVVTKSSVQDEKQLDDRKAITGHS